MLTDAGSKSKERDGEGSSTWFSSAKATARHPGCAKLQSATKSCSELGATVSSASLGKSCNASKSKGRDGMFLNSRPILPFHTGLV